MQCLRRVAEQYHARPLRLTYQSQYQRERRAQACADKSAGPVAKRPPKLIQKSGIVETKQFVSAITDRLAALCLAAAEARQ